MHPSVVKEPGSHPRNADRPTRRHTRRWGDHTPLGRNMPVGLGPRVCSSRLRQFVLHIPRLRSFTHEPIQQHGSTANHTPAHSDSGTGMPPGAARAHASSGSHTSGRPREAALARHESSWGLHFGGHGTGHSSIRGCADSGSGKTKSRVSGCGSEPGSTALGRRSWSTSDRTTFGTRLPTDGQYSTIECSFPQPPASRNPELAAGTVC